MQAWFADDPRLTDGTLDPCDDANWVPSFAHDWGAGAPPEANLGFANSEHVSNGISVQTVRFRILCRHVTETGPGDPVGTEITWRMPRGAANLGYTLRLAAPGLVTFDGSAVMGGETEGVTSSAGDPQTCNAAPDCSAAFAGPFGCWPPNHRFSLVQVLGVSDPDGDTLRITITGITQDESVTGTGGGSGQTCPDGVLVDGDGDGNPETAGVRCERSGRGNGRVYTISFRAADGKGGECGGAVLFCVPHSQSSTSVCSDDGVQFDAMAQCPAPGAGGGAGGEGGSPPVLTLDEFHALTPEPLFLRGDVDWGEDLVVTDPLVILEHLYVTAESMDCLDAADANDDGEVNVTDAILVLAYLFLGDQPPPQPHGVLGSDPTSDGLGCP